MRLKISLFIFCLAQSTGFLKSESLGTNLEPAPMPKASFYAPVLEYTILSGSSGLPLSFMSAFAFGGNISSGQMSEYEKLLSDNNRLGYYQNYSVSIFPSLLGTEMKRRTSNFQIDIENIAGLTFSRDAFRLFMQGNTPYLGKELNAGSVKFEQWRNRIFRFNLGDYKWNDWSFSPSIQLSQNLAYSRAETNGLKLFSNSNGDSLSFNGSGYLANKNYSFWGNGFGLQLGFNLERRISNPNSKYIQMMGIGLKNFGFYSLSEVNSQSRNAVWDAANGMAPVSYNTSNPINLTAVNIPANDLQVSNWLNRQKDSVNSKLNIVEMKRSGYVLSPYQISAFFYLQKWKSNQVMHRIRLNYLHMPGYLPNLTYTVIKPISINMNWVSKSSNMVNIHLFGGISLGGFDNFDINAGIQIPMKSIRGLNKPSLLNIQFYGLESMVVPTIFHGAGGSIRWLLMI